MKKADLYIRVSTDEQADKGYSQRDQEERLKRYCENNNIKVGQIIYEDYSAKTFIRPEWIKLLDTLKKKSSKTDLLLFTKWDRFSRNAGDAYQMINILRKINVEPQAIEQPLDLSIPENKMMLAIYLAAPEVENDRRALNTYYGMRRAKKEGRLMGRAPYGYANRITENGKKYVIPKEPEASNMKWAFNEMSKGVYSASQIMDMMNRKEGKSVKISAFLASLRNTAYCGKIYVEQFNEEKAHFVKSIHEPLISEELFEKVQCIMDGNVNPARPNVKVLSDDNLPLRGFLVCPECGHLITGSASTGRSGNKYYYYHCQSPCSYRYKSEIINSKFLEILQSLEMRISIKNYLKKVLRQNFEKLINNPQRERKAILLEIDRLNIKLKQARNKLMEEVIDDEDYLEIKTDCKAQIEKLEAKLTKGKDNKKIDFQKLLDQALSNLVDLAKVYTDGDIEVKRRIIGSIFPEKLQFSENHYRTTRSNVLISYIYQINNELGTKKNRKESELSPLSGLVPRTGIEPVLLRTGV
ncbi:recombinase family protein [Chryseobacterium sp. ES2]|uniref:Recombinase family protein n=2 Tax=Chryseobacterium TaxID=59732 RepID=A0ABU1E779_9FLAO|nr:recombinase family protein [Chryseobacterium sp. ES2]MDR4953653.1 recombinase family protein [Chryseobacterium sp. ES2]